MSHDYFWRPVVLKPSDFISVSMFINAAKSHPNEKSCPCSIRADTSAPCVLHINVVLLRHLQAPMLKVRLHSRMLLLPAPSVSQSSALRLM